MKYLKKIIGSILFIFTSLIFAQSWNNEVGCFLVSPNTILDSYTDQNGIHLVYSLNGGIKYARLNSSGGTIVNNITILSEGSNADFANINTVNGDVYVFYKQDDFIRVAKSSNLGQNWNANISSWQLDNTYFYSMETEVKEDYIHVVWSQTRVSEEENETRSDVHYIKFKTTNSQWQNYDNLTQSYSDGGRYPSIAFSENKVHACYQGSYFSIYTRDRNESSNSWESQQTVPIYTYPYATVPVFEKVSVQDSYLHVVYKTHTTGLSSSFRNVSHSYRSLNSSSWTQDQTIFNVEDASTNKPIVVAKTSDAINVIYYDYSAGNYVHKKLTGTASWSGVIANVGLSNSSNSLNSNGNDLYLVRGHDSPGSMPFYYRQYDAVPLAPANVTVSASPQNKPVISWSANNEPDRSFYKVYKKSSEEFGWQYLGTTSGTSYTDNSETIVVGGPVANEHLVYYRVTCVDLTSHESPASNSVSIRVYGPPLEKANGGSVSEVTEYSLLQNYPNPFNPTTTISWQTPVDGYTTLKVYDVLGKEVAVIVNEVLPAGEHSVQFNGSELTSGMYFYKLQVGAYTALSKMILAK